MQKIYALNHSPVDFYFSQNPRDFMVREVPLYPFSQSGEHLIINVRKKGLNTQEMLKILSCFLGCKISEIGYGGLKDKAATTTQYLSIHKKFSTSLQSHLPKLEERGIKILTQTYHTNKIKLGHLKGNDFFIRLKKVTPAMALQITQAIKHIQAQGLPNYFGYQRFGKYQDNHLEGQKILQKQARYSNKTLQNFLISSYQSHLFNQWLSLRMKINKIFAFFHHKEIQEALALEQIFLDDADIQSLQKQTHFFKIIQGDILSHYPHGKAFCTHAQEEDLQRFYKGLVMPTGLLYGKKSFLSSLQALEIEKRFIDPLLTCNGDRRYAWILPQNISYKFLEQEAWFELEFFLPKGSYATIFIEEIAHKSILVD